MPNSWKEKPGRRPLLVAGALLLVAVVAAAVTFLFWRSARNRQAEGVTSPTLVQTTGSGKAVSGVSVGVLETTSQGSSGPFVSLSEGGAAPEAVASLPRAAGEPLPDPDVASLLARLPDLGGEPEDQVDLLLPDESLPPPRPGQTIEEDFPPPAAPVAPPEVVTGPLEVLRYSP